MSWLKTRQVNVGGLCCPPRIRYPNKINVWKRPRGYWSQGDMGGCRVAISLGCCTNIAITKWCHGQVQDPWILSDVWEKLCSRGTSWNFCCTRSNSRCTSWEHAEYIPVASAPRTWSWQVRQVARQIKHDEYFNTFLVGRPPNESFRSWPGPVVCATSHKAPDGCGWSQGNLSQVTLRERRIQGTWIIIHKNRLKCCVSALHREY